jgi:hypothetical protein
LALEQTPDSFSAAVEICIDAHAIFNPKPFQKKPQNNAQKINLTEEGHLLNNHKPTNQHYINGQIKLFTFGRALANKLSSDTVLDIHFEPKGILCAHCQKNSCRHINFALTVPSIQKVITAKRREGWKLPAIIEE